MRHRWLLLFCLAATALPTAAQVTYDDFEIVVVGGDHKLDSATKAKIAGDSDCDGTPCATYLYFPAREDNGNQLSYLIDETIVIDRTTPLYLHGADILYSRLSATNPSNPLFKVVNAPLIQVSRMHLWPDPGNQQLNAVAFRFEEPTGGCNPCSDLEFQLVESQLEQSKLEIERKGTYRLQGTQGLPNGRVDAVIELDHPDATLISVGGIFNQTLNGGSGYEIPLCQGAGSCPGNDGCPTNPCDEEIYFIWQKDGRVQSYGTTTTYTAGRADHRFETAAVEPHIVAWMRSEGAKCETGYPSSHVYVPDSSEAVDILLLNNTGAWSHTLQNTVGDWCGGTASNPDQSDQFGLAHYIDYNAKGTVWLLGNVSYKSVGRLVVASENAQSEATIVALGNTYAGNTTANPRTLLPASHSEIKAGNVYSWGEYCSWCDDAYSGSCPHFECSLSSIPLGARKLVNPGLALTTYADVPAPPTVTVPQPIAHIPLTSGSTGVIATMIDVGECQDTQTPDPCAGNYPSSCSPKVCEYSGQSCTNNGSCAPSESCIVNDRCVLQAALNTGIETYRPVYVPSGTYGIDQPLYWVHGQQDGVDWPVDTCPTENPYCPKKLYGGWLVGDSAGVAIDNFLGGTVLASEGLAVSVIQDIAFKTDGHLCSDNVTPCDDDDDCSGSETCNTTNASAVRLENDPSFFRNTAQISFYGADFTGGRHALGICVDSNIQCDTIMAVDSTFSDARIGMAIGGANALHDFAYGATFDNNYVAMGHDPDGQTTQSGTFGAIHTSITNTGLKDFDLIDGIQHPYFFHGLQSTSALVFDESTTAYAPKGWTVVFDHSTIGNDGTPTDVYRYSSNGGAFFIDSDLRDGKVYLEDSSDFSKFAFKIESDSFQWTNAQIGTNSQAYELEFCDHVVCETSSECKTDETGCTTIDTGNSACLDRNNGTWDDCASGETVRESTCECKAAPFAVCLDEGVTYHCD